MSDIDLEAIEARWESIEGATQNVLAGGIGWDDIAIYRTAADVPALVAEVRRLRARVEDHHCG
jgi:hypothetical protein